MTYILMSDISPIANPDIVTEPSRAELEARLGVYNKEHGFEDHAHATFLLNNGVRFPGIPVPAAAMAARSVAKPMKRFPDMINMGIYAAISERMKDTIEALERDVHQFEMVPVYTSRAKTDPRTYYVWIVGAAIDYAVDFERTHVPVRENYGRKSVGIPRFVSDSKKIVLKVANTGHTHIWRAREISKQIMISDEMHDAFLQRKLWGFNCMPVTCI